MPRMSQSEVDAYNAKHAVKCCENEVPSFAGKESELHELIAGECRRRRIYFVHSRCDRATTQQKGVTDFICALPDGKTIWVECKVGSNKLSEEQTVTRHVLLALGHRHAVCRSFEDFLKSIE